MATYLELKEQAEKILAEAEALREREIAHAIADIRETMRIYALTVKDLGLGRGGVVKKKGGPAQPKAPGVVKYRNPEGLTWSGGRGRKPRWVVDALAAGKNLEDFAV